MRNLILLGTLIMLTAGFWALLRQLRDNAAEMNRPAPVVSFVPSPTPAVSPSPISSKSRATRKHASSSAEKWKEFQTKYGASLKGTFSSDGMLRVVRAESPQNLAKASSAYRSEDEAQVAAWAREILKELGELLGVQDGMPLAEAGIRADSVSAQATFAQEVEGLRLSPMGAIEMHLGSHGELLSLSSEYVPSVNIANQRSLNAQQAQSAAEATVGAGTALRTEGGRALLWLPEFRVDGPSAAYHAYEFNVQGRQTIVDAATGKVIFQKDRRNF